MDVMNAGKNILNRKIHFYRCRSQRTHTRSIPNKCFYRIEYLLLDNLGFIYYLLIKK
jgi:hypothetical protein